MLDALGAVRCFGASGSGRTGARTTNDIGDDPGELPRFVSPVDVGGVGAVTQLACGSFFTLALIGSRGAVRGWGEQTEGQLGYGTTTHVGDDEVPATMGDVDVGGFVVAIQAGGFHSCALLSGGAVRCWGRNSAGQLGLGHVQHIGDNETPRAAAAAGYGGDVLLGLPAGVHVTAVRLGYDFSCVLRSDGGAQCWGSNSYRELGFSHTNSVGDDELPARAGPMPLRAGGRRVVDMHTAQYFACLLYETNEVACHGYAGYGSLGMGNTNDVYPASAARAVQLDAPLPTSSPSAAPSPSVTPAPDHGNVPPTLLARGSQGYGMCASSAATRHRTACWGHGTSGNLGNGINTYIGDGGAR
jgi:alpha-tubulin suppressor-like RCC1 family protein